ncbi:MAG: N-acetylglucosamine-6-phosphate deacetylase [Woeseiaceae bacterium]
MTRRLLTGCDLFDGDALIAGADVVLDGATVAAVGTDVGGAPVDETIDLAGLTLAPGFVDLQVNGGGGVLFNDAPTVETLRTMAAAHRPFGTTACLPTLISDDAVTMRAAIAAVREAIAAGVPGIIGIHLEGPHLNPERRGVHDAAQMRGLDSAALDLLCSLGTGYTLVTLAPEKVDGASIRQLAASGIRVFAGHSQASYDEVRGAIDCGLVGFTHLFNAMSQLTGREPGVVGAALDDPDTFAGVIADGHHVHPASLGIALRAKPRGTVFLVTDAMPTVGSDSREFVLHGIRVSATGGRCVTDDGTLAGSDIGMIDAVRFVVKSGLADVREALRMAATYPAHALGASDRLGYVRPGYRANLVALDAELHVTHSFIDGEPERCG